MVYKLHLVTGQTHDIMTKRRLPLKSLQERLVYSNAEMMRVKKEPLSLGSLQRLAEDDIKIMWKGEPYISNCLVAIEDGLPLYDFDNPAFPQLVGNVIECKCVPGKDGYHFVGF